MSPPGRKQHFWFFFDCLDISHPDVYASADMQHRGMRLTLFSFHLPVFLPCNSHHFLSLYLQSKLHHQLHFHHTLSLHHPSALHHLLKKLCNPPLHHLHPLPSSIHPLILPCTSSPAHSGLLTLRPAGWSPVYWGVLLLNTDTSCSPTSLLQMFPDRTRELSRREETRSTHRRAEMCPLCPQTPLKEQEFTHHSWSSWRWLQI